MASTDNNFSLEDFGLFLKNLDEGVFAPLFEQTLQVLQSTSATGVYQTATDFEPAIYKRLEATQTTYADEFYKIGVSKPDFNTFLFFAIMFKDAYTCLLYESAKKYMGKKKGKSRKEQTITDVPNRNQGIADFTPMDMEIIEEPKHQSPVVPL
ncbi:unnamed protein product [Rhizophagus irregularis]|nr:unnamed protein product [Rhizophagus irregularis]CAB4435355.1 unnamed protein product [Rhizophagus irregularis]